MYRAARRDENEKRIVEFLRRCKCTVRFLDGPGIPDLLVGTPSGFNLLLEVKSTKGALTNAQHKFFDTWLGQVDVVRSIADVKEVLRRLMPVYVYRCDEEHVVHVVQRFDAEPLSACPTCKKPTRRQIQLPAIIYSGSGWTGAVKETRK